MNQEQTSHAASVARRKLGSSNLEVSPVGFGCWPIAGVSTLDVNDQDSIHTIHAAIDAGINHIDTAYGYGFEGEADKLLARVLKERRSEVVVASKVGQYFDAGRNRKIAGDAATLQKHSEEAVKRLGIDCVDIMYYHFPDPEVTIEESAEAIQKVIDRGLARYAGVSNVTAEQLRRFHGVCPVIVLQPPFNMLQQESVREIRSTCEKLNISICSYWALMKGLLAGKLTRDHQFAPNDKRLTYPIYQGEKWNRSQDFLDKLRAMAQDLNCTVAQLVIYWTIHQPAIDVALCGAKRPTQIEETAAAMCLSLEPSVLQTIDGWIAQVGEI